MSRKWTESEALRYLGSTKNNKTLVLEGGTRGLTGCSAVDYLRNYCGYTVVLK